MSDADAIFEHVDMTGFVTRVTKHLKHTIFGWRLRFCFLFRIICVTIYL